MRALLTLLGAAGALGQEAAGYTRHNNRIGCHGCTDTAHSNCGYIGRPKTFLDDVADDCRGGGADCIEMGRRACDSLGSQCIGFAVHTGWGVQIYNSRAIDHTVCAQYGADGLQSNSAWTTFLKETCHYQAFGANSGWGGTFVGQSCTDHGYADVTSASECDAAAAALGRSHTAPAVDWHYTSTPGCYLHASVLKSNNICSTGSSTFKCGYGGYECLCKSTSCPAQSCDTPPPSAAPALPYVAPVCWQQLCTSCDFSGSETRVATGWTLEQCKAGCAAESTCTALDFGKHGRTGQCYYNTGSVVTHHSHSNFDAYVPTPCPHPGSNPGAGGVSGDPFVSFGNKKTQVYLPLGKEMTLMQCDGGWQLRGTAFGTGVAGDTQQWFRSLAVRAAGAEQFRVEARAVAEVDKAREASDNVAVTVAVQDSTASRSPLTTLAIVAGGQAVTHATAGTSVRQPGFNYTVAQDTSSRIGSGFVESATVAAKGVEMEFASAAVQKTAEGGPVHVDLRIKKLDTAACRGPLPEIWGMVPMSQATAAMLVPPKVPFAH